MKVLLASMAVLILALPASPCVRNCCLDDGDICLGCGRHIEEILAWHGADAAQRGAILATSQGRMEARLQRRRGSCSEKQRG